MRERSFCNEFFALIIKSWVRHNLHTASFSFLPTDIIPTFNGQTIFGSIFSNITSCPRRVSFGFRLCWVWCSSRTKHFENQSTVTADRFAFTDYIALFTAKFWKRNRKNFWTYGKYLTFIQNIISHHTL